MRSRAWRLILVIVLLASGAGAALSGWTRSRLIRELDLSQRELSASVDRLLETLDAVTAAQQAHVEALPEQEPAAVSARLQQMRSETADLRRHLRSADADRALQSVSASVTTLSEIEAAAQEHVRLGQALMAADLVSSDGRSAGVAITSELRNLRAAESEAYAAARADALDTMWTSVGGVAVLWIVGLIVLARQPSLAIREESAPVASVHAPLTPADSHQEPALTPSVDLQAAADVCTSIGQLTSADDLPALLQRAASLLDASGVVVWMAAGEELFAAAAFGYAPHVLRRLGPINRSALNATAAAWRTGTLQAVAGTNAERSALVAPMRGPDRCVGVLAVEVRVGLEADAATRAVTTLLAAQLAAALAGWPAASAAAPLQAPPLDKALEA
jgi:hypothetical protein